MRVLVAVDPGLRGCGLAVFEDMQLKYAKYVENINAPVGRGPLVHHEMADAVYGAVNYGMIDSLIVEFPQIYPGAPDKDLNDLLDVAGVASAVYLRLYSRHRFAEFQGEHVLPHAWKGSIKKKVMTARIYKTLEPDEILCIESVGAKDHNTLDAIGIGLWKLGRLNKKVYANE